MTRPIRSRALRSLPPFLFVEIDRLKKERIRAGADVVDLGVGDPDRPTPRFIIDALCRAAQETESHRYPPPGKGSPDFRGAASAFMRKRFGVEADADRHVLSLIGSKDGITHLALGVVDPGDVILIPSVAYPGYRGSAIFAHAEIVELPTRAATGWRPDFSAIPVDVRKRARLMWLNYPNNPTAVMASREHLAEAVRFADENDIILALDNAYSELYFDEPPLSLWQAEGADLESFKGIEFHSLSKTFNMAGWRMAFAVGHAEVVGALTNVKDNFDSGQFNAVQLAGAEALRNWDHAEVRAMREVYRERRDALAPGLREIGCEVENPAATFFVWFRVPEGYDGMSFCKRCIEEADVVFVPGIGFGEDAARYARAALTIEADRIREGVKRLKAMRW